MTEDKLRELIAKWRDAEHFSEARACASELEAALAAPLDAQAHKEQLAAWIDSFEKLWWELSWQIKDLRAHAPIFYEQMQKWLDSQKP